MSGLVRRALMAAAKRRNAVASDPLFGNVVFLTNYSSGSIADVKGHTVTANGNAAISGGKLVLDGAGDYLRITTDSTLRESIRGNFCLEVIISANSGGEGAYYLSGRTGGGVAPFLCYINASGGDIYPGWFGSSNGSSWDAPDYSIRNEASVIAAPMNTDVHIALYRNGSFFYTAVNGAVITKAASTSALLWNPGEDWIIGGDPASAQYFTGNIKAVRITTVARYGSSNFTAPTSFPEA